MDWHNLTDPNDPALDQLAASLHLHPLHVEDCRSDNERAKAEQGPGYIFAVLKAVTVNDNCEVTSKPLCIFAGNDFCITLIPPDSAPAEHALERARSEARQKPTRILYLILDSLIDSYFPLLDKMDDELDELEDRVIQYAESSMLEEIFRVKRAFVALRRMLVNTRDLTLYVQHAATTMPQLFDPGLEPFLRDSYDHVARLLDLLETQRDLLNNSLDIYLSSVANRTNETMKVLTVLSTIAIPALVITGIFGMNIPGLPLMHNQHAAVTLASLTVGITLLLIVMLRRHKWL